MYIHCVCPDFPFAPVFPNFKHKRSRFLFYWNEIIYHEIPSQSVQLPKLFAHHHYLAPEYSFSQKKPHVSQRPFFSPHPGLSFCLDTVALFRDLM